MSDETTGDTPEQRQRTLAQLRSAIGELESDGRPAPSPAKPPRPAVQPAIDYPGMPTGDDWLQRIPARYHDGERGFDRRIMEQLAAVGAPCYTLNDLTKVRSVPQGIPIFIDWLTHLEERIPGPETDHRQAIRANLIRNLNDSAARGNRAAIELLIAQVQRRPPFPGGVPDFAVRALARIATKKDFERIAALLEDLPYGVPKGPLIEYLGKVKSPEAIDIVLRYLDTEWTYFALKALLRAKVPGVHDRIVPHLEASNAMVRKLAAKALRQLPARATTSSISRASTARRN